MRSAVKHDTSPPLRDMKIERAKLDETNAKALQLRPHGVPREAQGDAAKQKTAAVQTGDRVVTDALPDFDQNFEGVGNVNGVLPPDTQGDVGPNHYVQMINLSFAVYSKTGQLLFGPFPNTALWQGFGGICETFNGGDPITIYDEEADRWFMSQLAYPGGAQGFHACIAVSATPDPMGAYHRYDFLYSQTLLNDYPKFGIWRDSYTMTANDFLNGAVFNSAGVQAYERDAMLAGQPADVVTFHIGNPSGIYASLLPADAEGQALGFGPPAGSPAPFVMFDDDSFGFSPTDRLLMWDLQVDWANPAAATLGVGPNHEPNRFFETAPFDSNLCNYARSCIPQPGTSVGLDAFGDRLLHRLAYRNFGGSQGMTVNHAVDVGPPNDHAGIRWYELTNSGSGWSIAQQGTFAPDGDNRWMGSGALDASGNLAMGYSVSSSTKFPSISLAGRLAGDPAGQLAQGENELIAGGGSQTHAQSRWGDYSAMQIDPTDGCTFWFTTEYLTATSVADWRTRIGSFKFPSCTAGPHGDLVGTVTNSSNNQPIAGALVSTPVATTTTDSQGQYSLTLPADTYDVTFSAFGFVTETAPGVVISDGGTTTLNAALDPAPSVTLSGTVTDGSGHGWPLYAKIEVTGRPGGPIFTNPETGEYSVEVPAGATHTVTYTATLPGYQVVTDEVEVGSGDTTHDVEIPIQENCTAPGYGLTAQLISNFNNGLPPGWLITDEIGNNQTWSFQDIANRGNLTGGDGGFAIIDSDRFGPGQTQDTSLVTPVVDLSDVDAPVVGFNEDYLRWPDDVAVDVDVSIDGGTTWQNAFHEILVSRRGPRETTVPIPQAANQSNVKVRWRYRSTFGFWWEVDNPYVGVRTCEPVPGGLVIGNVNDANTSSGLNGANVTSVDRPADKGTSVATPDDPNVGDGYYQLFSSLTGSHPFTASKALYQSQTQTVDVAADDASRADFTLGAGRVEVTPTEVTRTQLLGTTTTTTLNFTNTGTAPATVELSERKGAFQILTKKGAPLIKMRLTKGAADPGWLGNHRNDEAVPGIDAGPPAQPTWSPIAQYPMNIVDNAIDQVDGRIYSVAGVTGPPFVIIPDAFVYDPGADSWSPIADVPQPREKPGAAGIGGKLYVSGGWDTSGVPIAATVAYDPDADTWTTVAPNPAPRAAPGTAVLNDQLYQVGGCIDGFCAPSNTHVRYDPASDTWETLAPYPHTTSWISCGGIDGKVYCAGGIAGGTAATDGFVYDPAADSWSPIANMPFNLWGSAYGAPNGMFVISSGLTNQQLTNQGLAYDPSSDSWSALPNAQFPRHRAGGACGFYKVGGSSVPGFGGAARDSERLSELDQCGVTDIPWLLLNRTSLTLQPGQSGTVVVFLSASEDVGVTQPGAYTAELGVSTNTPTGVDPIPVTMNVTPPPSWGKIAGTVTGIACNGTEGPIRDAQVQANGSNRTFSLFADRDGKWAFWAPQASNPYQIIVSKDGWIAQVRTVRIIRQQTVTADFTLQRVRC